jgi:23S rRNA-/tRNA-specific pseudouridylate synthase
VKVCEDVLAKLPTGGPIPREWWFVPEEGLEYVIKRDTRLCVTRHVHEPAVRGTAPKIIFEDDRLVVVDKPAGIPSLAGVGPGLAGENSCAALVNRLRGARAMAAEDDVDGSGRSRPRPEPLFAVNRVDKPVSGIWLTAKGSKLSAKIRNALTKEGAVKAKTYLALLRGRVPTEGFTATAPLRVGIDGYAEAYVEALEGGRVVNERSSCRTAYKPAVTRVSVVAYVPKESFGDGFGEVDTLVTASLVLAGRFHQIRAHCAFAGHPVVGDAAYDGSVDGFAPTMGGSDPRMDDERGTLRRMRAARRVAWCAECAEPPETAPGIETSVGKTVVAGAYICLHALAYAFAYHGREYRVRTETLPPFAEEALRRAGWPPENRTPEKISGDGGG